MVSGVRVSAWGGDEVGLVVEGDHPVRVAQAVDEGAARCGVHAPLAHPVGLRPFGRSRIDREQHGGAGAVHLDVDGASVVQLRLRASDLRLRRQESVTPYAIN